MRKFVVCAVFLLLATGIAYANDSSVGKKIGPYDVSLKMDHTPAVVGVNEVSFEVKKGARPVSDVDPEIGYFMLSMPAMNYTTRATRKGDAYSAVVKPTMPGEWEMKVKIKGPDGKTVEGAFKFMAK